MLERLWGEQLHGVSISFTCINNRKDRECVIWMNEEKEGTRGSLLHSCKIWLEWNGQKKGSELGMHDFVYLVINSRNRS